MSAMLTSQTGGHYRGENVRLRVKHHPFVRAGSERLAV